LKCALRDWAARRSVAQAGLAGGGLSALLATLTYAKPGTFLPLCLSFAGIYFFLLAAPGRFTFLIDEVRLEE